MTNCAGIGGAPFYSAAVSLAEMGYEGVGLAAPSASCRGGSHFH